MGATVTVEEPPPAAPKEDLPAPKAASEAPGPESLTVPLQTPTPAPSRPITPDSPPKSVHRPKGLERTGEGLQPSTQRIFRDVMKIMARNERAKRKDLGTKKYSVDEVQFDLVERHDTVRSRGGGRHARVFEVCP